MEKKRQGVYMNGLFYVCAIVLLFPLLAHNHPAQAKTARTKEIALSFDDSPMPSTRHYETYQRTNELIQKLKSLNVPPVMVFTNPCKRDDSSAVVAQLKRYKDAGHFIGNHTCTHPRLDDVGFEAYSKDAAKADQLLSPLLGAQKFFRFPFLNESDDGNRRDQMREWLGANGYRNGMVSVDTDDYIFSSKVNQAKEQGRRIDYEKVEELFVDHIVGAANFYDALAVEALGYSPKHVLLLHEMDATVMFIEPLIKALRKDGWKIIGVDEAYQDQLYTEQPKNTYANNGIVAQIKMEKSGERIGYNQIDKIKDQLNEILDGMRP